MMKLTLIGLIVSWSIVNSVPNINDVFVTFDGKNVLNSNADQERAVNLFNMVREANEKFQFKPGKVYFNLFDTAEKSSFRKKTYLQTFLANDSDTLLKTTGPDWTCLNYPSAMISDYTYTTYFIMAAGEKPAPVNKVAWFGNVATPEPYRYESKTRPLLLKYTADYPDYFSFYHTVSTQNHVDHSLPDIVSTFAFLLDIGGNGYSGRLKYLLHSNRPLLYVERDYVEYFNHLLQPYVHYIPVKKDLSDLVSQFEWLLANPDKGKEIALNAQNFAIEHLCHDAFIDRVGEVISYLLEDGH